MKKWMGWTLAVGLCLALLVCGALADEAPGITVQLDGQALTFTDAVPQVKDQRTFLPFRAVFEAMGAQVDYEGSVITAARGDKTLTMTLDQTAATVTQGEVVTPITMDVAPYVDPATWRTYVPVRFAAQAFGCSVGWDQEAQTAIVIDTDKLVAQAMEGKSFTYLEKLAAMNEKYDQGIWDMSASFDADLSSMGVSAMNLEGDVKGTVQDSDKLSMDMNMKLDMTTFVQMLSLMSGESLTGQGLPDEAQAMLDALKTDGVKVAMRGDMSTGKLYMNMDMGVLNAQAEVDPETWYELDMAALMEQLGMDWTALMAQSKSVDVLDTAKLLLATVEPNDAANGYDQVKAAVDDMAAALSDESFVLDSGAYVSTYALKTDDIDLNVNLALDMEGETLKGFYMDMDMAGQTEGQTMKMSMAMSMNDKDEMTARVNMDMGGLMSMTMTMEGAYAPGTAAPVTTPPEGATVIPFADLAGEDAAWGVIGGADGPTAIIAAD